MTIRFMLNIIPHWRGRQKESLPDNCVVVGTGGGGGDGEFSWHGYNLIRFLFWQVSVLRVSVSVSV